MNNWNGATVVILASGPSVTPQQIEIVRRWHENGQGRVVVINTTWESAPFADVLYGCARWWTYHHEAVRKGFRGECWTEGLYEAKAFGLHHVTSKAGEGLSRDPEVVFRGGGLRGAGNSGYQAINLVRHWGARRMILVGFDMHKGERGRQNHHRPHVLNIESPYQTWLAAFPRLAADLQEDGVEVLNATPGSSLRSFSMIELSEALRARPVLAA